MIADQAEALRSLVADSRRNDAPVARVTRPETPIPSQADSIAASLTSARPSAHVIAVTSGKGGVGKSNVSVNLAISLAKRGKKVVLLDADLGTANIDVLCNVDPRGNLSHVMSGQRTLEQILIPAPGGFELIAGASGLSDIAQMTGYQRKKLIEQLFKLESDADYIIIDTGAGVGSNVLGFALSADEIIVVTTPEPTAITDAYAVMKTMAKCRKNLDLNVVVNMTRGKKEGAEVFQRVEAVSQRFLQLSPRFLGELPFDDAVFEAVRARQPFALRSENCAASKQIKRIAATFDLSPARAKRAGLIHRISAWFGAGNSLTKAR